MHVVIRENEVNFVKKSFRLKFYIKSEFDYIVVLFDNDKLNFWIPWAFLHATNFADKWSRMKFAEIWHLTTSGFYPFAT